jgi:hypothetical protein
MIGKRPLLIAIWALAAVSSARAICPYDANCINNPYTGRNPVAPWGGAQGGGAAIVAPFSRYSTNQLNPDFSANPLRNGVISNPYAPAPKPTGDLGTLAPSGLGSGGLGSGMIGSNGGLQGFDPDRR